MCVLSFTTSPNSGVKFFGGFLRSEKTISLFIFVGCASFSLFFFFLCCDRARPSGTNGSQQQHEMQVQLTRRVFDLYDHQCQKMKYIMENVLTDVQRRAVQQWVDETEMKKSLERLKKEGMLSDSDSDGH